MSRRFIREDLRRAWIAFWVERRGFMPFRAGNLFEGGHVFDFGTTRMEAVHAPGHCDDHYGFYFPAQRILFTTDIDFSPFGPWYGNEESNIDEFMASVRRLQAYKVRAVVSSHAGLITKGIREAFDSFLKVFEERDRAILDFLSRPRSLEDFVDRALIYRRYPDRPEILRFWERQMIAKHLKRLVDKKVVSERQGRFMLQA
jgi:glyoxylase-like metal-dependent hydrolase (beta-lactamase superfamily II)